MENLSLIIWKYILCNKYLSIIKELKKSNKDNKYKNISYVVIDGGNNEAILKRQITPNNEKQINNFQDVRIEEHKKKCCL